MKLISALVLVATTSSASAFVVSPSGRTSAVATSSALNMGFLDFFSAEEREKREAKKQAEIEEQMRLQAEIYERRKNPEKMEEYEQKVMKRRELRMAGKDSEAEQITMYDGDADMLKPTTT